MTTKRVALALAVLATAALASAQLYKGFPKGYCTFYAAQEFDKGAPNPGVKWRGNAARWVDRARDAGWQVQTDVKSDALPSGTLAVWDDGGLGHVAVVRGADASGITVEEMNWGPHMVDAANGKTDRFDCVDRTRLTYAQVAARGRTGKYKFAGYILPKRR